MEKTKIGTWRIGSLLILSVLSGCATPLVHPLRVPSSQPDRFLERLVAEGATSIGYPAGRHGSCKHGSCGDSEDTRLMPDQWNVFQGSLGYSHLFWDTLGLMAGLYGPAVENMKEGSWYNMLALWTFATVQNENFSFGLGPEIGGGGWALTVGAEWQPWGIKTWKPAIGLYGRIFWPFEYDHSEFDGKERTWEVGGRVRFGYLYIQYTYYTQVGGVMSWAYLYDDTVYAQGLHIISIGASLTRDSVPR